MADRRVPEALRALSEISGLLNTGLSPTALASVVALIEAGVPPEALAAAIVRVRDGQR